AAKHSGRRDPAKGKGHAHLARPTLEEREIESVKIVILDDIGIGTLNRGDEPPNEIRLAGVSVSRDLQRVCLARGQAHGDHEDTVPLGIEARRLQIELEAAKLIECEIFEVRAAG